MSEPLIKLTRHDRSAELFFNRPKQRNAMSIDLFDAFENALNQLADDTDCTTLLIGGHGPAFCAGFDLEAAFDQPELIETYIHRLSGAGRMIRRLPQIVTAVVHGPAIAGGSAVLSACDFVFVSPEAAIGYPAHRLGVSAAVTIPTLRRMLGDGNARTVLLGGEVVNGREAKRLGLASHLIEDKSALLDEARAFCKKLREHGPIALRATKRWLNELDEVLSDETFDLVCNGSASLCRQEEAATMLDQYWQSHRNRSQPVKI